MRKKKFRSIFVWLAIPSLILICLLSIGWTSVLRWERRIENAYGAMYEETQLTLLRTIAKSVCVQLNDDFSSDRFENVGDFEQYVFTNYIETLRLSENARTWMCTPDYVVVSRKTKRFPKAYYNMPVRAVFEKQEEKGASHYEEILAAIESGAEGSGWYIWDKETGKEIAAWTTIVYNGHQWTVGMSTPLADIMGGTSIGQDIEKGFLFMWLATLAAIVLFAVWLFFFFRQIMTSVEFEKYQFSVEHSSIATFWICPTGVIEHVNEAAQLLSGYSRRDLVGSYVFDLDINVNVDDWRGRYERVKKNGVQKYESRYRIKNNKEIPVDVLANFMNTGGREYVIAFVSDVSERKEMEEGLRKYSFLVNTSGDFMSLVDKEYRYISVNRAYCEAKDIKEEDIVGKTVYEMWGGDIFERELKSYFDRCFKGEIVEYGAWFEFSPSQLRYLSVSYYPFRNEAGEVTNAVVVSRDTTEIKYIDDKMRKDFEDKQKSIRKAQELQKNLNTPVLPVTRHYDMQAMFMPSEELGGDFFNVSVTPDDKIVIILGDSTGHGIEASMDATLLKSICDRYISFFEKAPTTDRFLEFVNRDMTKYVHDGRYPALFAGIIDPKHKKLYYSNASGMTPYVVNGGELKRLGSVKGFFLGFEEETRYEVKEYELAVNDVLVFFSDALIEMETIGGEIIGRERLEALLCEFSPQLSSDLRNFVTALKKYNIELPLEDDLSIILINYLEPFNETHTVHTCEELEEVRSRIKQTLYDYGYSQNEVSEISLCFHEIGTNAIEHGNKGNTSKSVTIEISIDCAEAVMSVEDEGEGFDPETLHDPTNLDKLMKLIGANDEKYARGRGVWISRIYADVQYNERGNKATMRRKRQAPNVDFHYSQNTSPKL